MLASLATVAWRGLSYGLGYLIFYLWMFRGVGARLYFSLYLMLWVTGDFCIPNVFTSNIPLVFPLGCAGGPLSAYAILDYVLSPRESWKSMHYVLWKKLSVPKATGWACLKNVQLFFSPSTKTKAQPLSERQKDMRQEDWRLFNWC